ncbi:TRAP-type C4-dicarboxylate transport system, small permease component [Oscillibacter sp. PC13]|nr:TRAP-type C4-dicarboxylate transport system, small permease component [Oscillibacter sp. PC13]
MLRPFFRKWCIMFKKILKGIRNAELIIAGVLFSTALVVLTLNVIFRRVSALPALDWAEEYMRYCSIWITFLGMSLCAEDDSHVGVDIFYQLSRTKARKVLKILCMMAACIFCALYSVACTNYVLMALKNMQRSAVMQVPLWIVYLSLPIGAILSTLQYALRLMFYIRVDHKELADKVENAADINLLDLN